MAESADAALQLLAINTVRTLSMDAVQAADSGHPGTPMALAPLAYAIYHKHLRHNPADPHWPNRDRFVLSCGHASMLLYSALYLTGYDLSLDDIKQFRQWGSKTPGHPEVGHTAGVETTTGPLGQGLSNAVGMAFAERNLAATFNRDGHAIIDHYTWFIASDGDLMEGISHEAASFAGFQKLGKLIGFFDNNHITIDGGTDISCADEVAERFEAYGWHVQHIADVNDLNAIDRAIDLAKAEKDRPSMIVTRTHIGYGSPNKVDTSKAHGEALGKDEIVLTKKELGWPSEESFFVPDAALAHWREAKDRGAAAQDAWRRELIAYSQAFPDDAKELGRRLHGDLPGGWEATIPVFDATNGNIASRAASGAVINAFAAKMPEFIGGSADLAGSTLTTVKGAPFATQATPAGRNVHFGIREHAMGSVMNGMALHGGVIPYGGTFLVFSDYMRPAIRLAALMRQQAIYVFTHDSIGLGEDGPTHQPVEQLSALRAIPNLLVIRPADANETAEAWKVALKHRTGPTAIVLTRQKLSLIDRAKSGAASGVARGAYVVVDSASGPPRAVIMASGSEVEIALKARDLLAEERVGVRVVSMPCHELFAQQPAEYRESVLPKNLRRAAIEAAHPMSWYRWVGTDGVIVGIDHFGASAPYQKLYEQFGITAAHLVESVRTLIARDS
ncbi:MAG TPA: transketolase [Gemmatimonadaceae bacterium]|nr:transketolase [Gemmatimonadaceae bacterium]